MLTSIVRALRGVQPEIDLTVISGNPAETSAKHKVKSIYRFNFFKIYNALKNADMLLSGGGSLLQDVTSLRSLFVRGARYSISHAARSTVRFRRRRQAYTRMCSIV